MEVKLDLPQNIQCLFLHLHCQILLNLSLQHHWAILGVVWCDCLLAFFGDCGFINLSWIPNVHIHPCFNTQTRNLQVCSVLMWIANSQKCLEEESSSREYLCYLFSPGVCFLMFAEETWIPFCRKSLNVYICYQWLLCPLIPGAFREDVARGKHWKSHRMTKWWKWDGYGAAFKVFILEFHSKKQRGRRLHLQQGREREGCQAWKIQIPFELNVGK